MKKNFATALTFAAHLAILAGSSAQAANKYWDTTAGLNNGVGGSGTWGTTFSTTSAGDASLTTAATTDDVLFQGTAGVVTLGANQTANSLTFSVSGFTLTPDATTARAVAGAITLAAGINLNLNDSAATTNRTLSLNSNLSSGAGATVTIQGAQAAGAASRVNLAVSGVSISAPVTINGSSNGVVGIVGTATGTAIGADITNNSSAKTGIGATSGNALTVNGKIRGSAGLQFSAGDSGGAGTITLNAASDYAGSTTFNAASSSVIKLGVDNALSSGTDVTMAATAGNGGILDLNGHDQTIGSLTSGVGGGSITNNAIGTGTNTLTISGAASPAGFGLAISDGATRKTALVRGGAGTTTLSGINTYTGGTSITGGTLKLGSGTALADTGAVSISGGVLDLNNANETVGAVSMTGGSLINSGGSSKILTGSSLTKTASGTATIGSNAGFAGSVAVNGGKLIIGGSISGATVVGSGGTLGGTGSLAALTVQSGGTLSPGNSPGTLSASSASFAGGGNFIMELNAATNPVAGTTHDLLAVSGALDLSGVSAGAPFVLKLQTLNSGNTASAALGDFDGAQNYSWTFLTAGSITNPAGGFSSTLFTVDTTGFLNSFTGGFQVVENGSSLALQYQAVPEPQTWLCMISGGATLLLLRRRSRA